MQFYSSIKKIYIYLISKTELKLIEDFSFTFIIENQIAFFVFYEAVKFLRKKQKAKAYHLTP